MRPIALALTTLAFCLLGAVSAQAQPVLLLDDGDVRRVNDPHLPRADLRRPPKAARSSARRAPPLRASRRAERRTRRDPSRRGPSFRAALRDMLVAGHIDRRTYNRSKRAYNNLKRVYKRATGVRRTNLRAVLVEADDMSRRGFVTPPRLPAHALTLERNRKWWTEGSIPRHGQRIEFEGSELVWQYYAGKGIHIQQLGNFGKANALWRDKKVSRLRALLDELVSLGSDRGGGLAFEYFFEFGGGEPPWTSGLSQATALQALARATALTGDPKYRDAATRGLAVFEQPPPTGVRVDGEAGPHYLIYTFNPELRVINAFLQAIIGLHDFTQLTGDPRARALYEAGDAQARVETPRYNTGAWSLYSQSRESDLGYHKLTRRFLKRLCQRVGAPVYCDTAQAFTDQLSIDPVVTARTRRVRGGKPARLKFKLSKISRVGVTVADSRGRAKFSTSAVVGYGNRFFTWRNPPVKAGRYTLSVSAVDLAGNRGQTAEVPLRVLKGKRSKRSRSSSRR